jgi:hypothetical protein
MSPHHTTARPSRIHFLTRDNQPACGARHITRAWHHSAWPTDLRLWPHACLSCWDQAHRAVSRTSESREVA